LNTTVLRQDKEQNDESPEIAIPQNWPDAGHVTHGWVWAFAAFVYSYIAASYRDTYTFVYPYIAASHCYACTFAYLFSYQRPCAFTYHCTYTFFSDDVSGW
jgi:hypothetical protein